MLKPADGIEGVKNAILAAVKDAGPNACPPMVVGVGIGGTFEKCALLAKQALTRPVNEHSDIPYVKEMEEEMLTKINHLGIGPGTWRHNHSTGSQHQYLSDPYRRTSCGNQYLLSCQQTCGKRTVRQEVLSWINIYIHQLQKK